MKIKIMFVLATALLVQAASLAAQEAAATNKVATKRVVFAQSCFWTGEMKLGQIEGVVRTEAGYFKGREVTLVEYAPERIALEDLARQARQAGVADTMYLESGAQRSFSGISNGASLDKSYRVASASDQKKQIEDTFAPATQSRTGNEGQRLRARGSKQSVGMAYATTARAAQERTVKRKANCAPSQACRQFPGSSESLGESPSTSPFVVTPSPSTVRFA